MNTSMFSSSPFGPIGYPQTMSKRLIQEEKPGEDERVVAKSKPGAKLSVEDSQLVSNSAECEYISQLGDTHSKKFKFGISRYGKP